MPIGPWELVIILIIVVVIFGAGRLSQVGGAMGKSVREFRSAVHEDQPAEAAHSTPVAAAPAHSTPVAAAPEVRCAACQATNPATQKFCSHCGGPLASAPTVASPAAGAAAAETTCPSCATVNPPGQAFCGQCGTRLSRAA